MYYSIPNVLATAVTTVDKPWELCTADMSPPDKDTYTAWSKDFHTRSHFISGHEGRDANLRVGDDNESCRMHQLIVDYDTPCTVENLERLRVAAYSEFLPSWAAITFSGHLRLIWDFERPIMVTSNAHVKKLGIILHKVLKLGKWHAGLDAPALGNPGQYYHVGRVWHHINPGKHIPFAHLCLWAYEAGKTLTFDADNRYKVPMALIEAEVKAKFPNRWLGAFQLGSRGVRFWDPHADHPSGAIVREDGMQCFTGNEAFVSWRQIFGQKFVEQFEASKVASILDTTAYDGKVYWVYNLSGDHWVELSREDFTRNLKRRGFDSQRKRGFTYSEIDEIEDAVVINRRVSRALPFLYFPPGVITYKGDRYLNTSHVEALKPAAPITTGPLLWTQGPTYFPFIHEFLNTMFNNPREANRADPQLMPLLAWIKYAYDNARAMTPQQGQIIVLAGLAGKGKTLFVRHVLGGLFGGEPSDGTTHLVDGSPWTDLIATRPIMFVDDALATGNQQNLNRFSNMLKKYASTAMLCYNAKYKQTGQIPWLGRVVIACNTDSESLRILPNMDMSNRNKISLFRTSDHLMDFPVKEVTEKKIAEDLPYFARFLADWTIPAELLPAERRYGVQHYHHPDLLIEAQHQGTTGVVEDVLTTYLQEYRERCPQLPYWSGTAALLYNDLSAANAGIMKDVKYHALGVALGTMQKNGRDVRRVRSKTGVNIWLIGWELFVGDTTRERHDSLPRPVEAPITEVEVVP